MSTEKKIAADVATLGELRSFLQMCEQFQLADSTRLHARTRLSWSADGPRLAGLKAIGDEAEDDR